MIFISCYGRLNYFHSFFLFHYLLNRQIIQIIYTQVIYIIKTIFIITIINIFRKWQMIIMNKKIFFILLILIAIFSIASVNASENMTFSENNDVFQSDEYNQDYYDEPDTYIVGFFENQSTQLLNRDSINWNVKNATISDEYGEWDYYMSTFNSNGVEYTTIHVLPTSGVYADVISVKFNPDEYDVYDGIYYKLDSNNRITDVIDFSNYESIGDDYYHFVGLFCEFDDSEKNGDCCIINNECYKLDGTISPFVVGFFKKAVRGTDYIVYDGKYYTPDGEAIEDFYNHYYGISDEGSYAEDVINGFYFESDDGIYYKSYAARYAISPYDYIKVNDMYHKVVTGKGTYKTTESYGGESYEVDMNNKYALIDGKLYPFNNEKLSDLPVNLIKQVKVNAPDVIKYFGGSERFTVTLTDENNRAIANANVKISINGHSYTKTTDNNGAASIGINLNSGKYDVTTEYGEKRVYSSVTVKDTVTANDFTKMYKNGTQYYGTFVDSQGNPLANTDVMFNINGVHYTRTTNNLGVAKMNINLNPKTYVLTAKNPVSGEQHTTRITVLPNIVENYDLTKYYRNNSQYSVKLLDDVGKPAGAGVNVVFNINGVFYTRSTDANGYAKININLGAGDYIITAEYKGLMASNKIKVLPILSANDLKMTYKDGSKFVATLLDGQGNAYSGQTVRFNINGVFYDRVTDSNGQAKLNINLQAGTYTITSTYNGFNIANTVIIEHSNKNTDDEMFYIDLPSYDTTTTVNKGKYIVEVHEWRVPPYCELDIILFDSNYNQISKFDYETYYNFEGKWNQITVNEWGSNYHKARFGPNDHVYEVAVKLKGNSWY